MNAKTDCCPGATLCTALLIIGLSGAAILSYVPGVRPARDNNSSAQNQQATDPQQSADPATDQPPAPKVPPKKSKLARNLWLEIEGDTRRVLVESIVCLREGPLEQLLTKRNTKEHEAILSADIDVTALHTALLACGAKAGSPIRFEKDKIVPPSGGVIKVTLEYKDKKGKTVRVPGQQWIRGLFTKNDLIHDWVFAGSIFYPDPSDPKGPPSYGADVSGDVICVANMETALLDLPIPSNRDNAELNFEAATERIPPLGTPVLIILEPVKDKMK